MQYNWSPFAVGGAAARPDSFTGLRPEFAAGVYQMVNDAHAQGIPLQITSAYRSPEVQAKLYQDALAKYGSEQAARKWVAPPGRSQHNHGTAVDFALNGSLIRDANSPAAQWIKENAARYGLAVPMSWEPWQVEMAGARGQKADQKPMTYGALGPAPTPMASGQQPLTYGAKMPEQSPPSIADQLAAIAASSPVFAPMDQPLQIQPRQVQAYQPQRRDMISPYLSLFQRLMG